MSLFRSQPGTDDAGDFFFNELEVTQNLAGGEEKGDDCEDEGDYEDYEGHPDDYEGYQATGEDGDGHEQGQFDDAEEGDDAGMDDDADGEAMKE